MRLHSTPTRSRVDRCRPRHWRQASMCSSAAHSPGRWPKRTGWSRSRKRTAAAYGSTTQPPTHRCPTPAGARPARRSWRALLCPRDARRDPAAERTRALGLGGGSDRARARTAWGSADRGVCARRLLRADRIHSRRSSPTFGSPPGSRRSCTSRLSTAANDKDLARRLGSHCVAGRRRDARTRPPPRFERRAGGARASATPRSHIRLCRRRNRSASPARASSPPQGRRSNPGADRAAAAVVGVLEVIEQAADIGPRNRSRAATPEPHSPASVIHLSRAVRPESANQVPVDGNLDSQRWRA